MRFHQILNLYKIIFAENQYRLFEYRNIVLFLIRTAMLQIDFINIVYVDF
jgi:hypothetical protein